MLIGVFSETVYNKVIGKVESDIVLLGEEASSCEILITGRLNEDDLDKYPNLRCVIVPYTGLNGLCLEALDKRGVMVYNLHFHSHFVAEKAVQLSLSLLGKVVEYHNKLKQGNWSERTNDNRIYWDTMFGKKIGIYGYGHIGKNIHQLLKPFNIEVYSINRGTDLRGVYLVSDIEELVRSVDILFVAVPLTIDTKDSINKEILDLMKGKYLVNVARGIVVNEDALYKALVNKVLKGYASDVWYQYPKRDEELKYPSKHSIHELENVVLSPHVAGFTKESTNRRYSQLVELINKVIDGNYSDKINISKRV